MAAVDAEAEAPGDPDAAAEDEGLIAADADAARVGPAGPVAEAVADVPAHPAARMATAMAAQRNVRIVALERRLIDSPIGPRPPRIRGHGESGRAEHAGRRVRLSNAGTRHLSLIPDTACNPGLPGTFC